MRRRVALTAFPVVGLATSGPLATLVDAALTEPSPIPRRVGAEEVEQVRAMGAEAFEMTKRSGGGGVRERLGGQLRWAVGLLDAHIDPSAYGPLHSAVGGLARSAGWLAHDMGVYTSANRCCEVALYCAQCADDWSLRGKSLRDLSRITEYLGDGDAALTLAQQALLRSDRITVPRNVPRRPDEPDIAAGRWLPAGSLPVAVPLPGQTWSNTVSIGPFIVREQLSQDGGAGH